MKKLLFGNIIFFFLVCYYCKNVFASDCYSKNLQTENSESSGTEQSEQQDIEENIKENIKQGIDIESDPLEGKEIPLDAQTLLQVRDSSYIKEDKLNDIKADIRYIVLNSYVIMKNNKKTITEVVFEIKGKVKQDQEEKEDQSLNSEENILSSSEENILSSSEENILSSSEENIELKYGTMKITQEEEIQLLFEQKHNLKIHNLIFNALLKVRESIFADEKKQSWSLNDGDKTDIQIEILPASEVPSTFKSSNETHNIVEININDIFEEGDVETDNNSENKPGEEDRIIPKTQSCLFETETDKQKLDFERDKHELKDKTNQSESDDVLYNFFCGAIGILSLLLIIVFTIFKIQQDHESDTQYPDELENN